MCRTRSNRFVLAPLAALLLLPVGARAQEAAAGGGAVVSSEISLSRVHAELDLELAGGRSLEVAVRNGKVMVDGNAVGEAPRGGELDRAWRELLNQAMETPADRLGDLLIGWKPPAGAGGERLDQALENAITAAPDAADVSAPADAMMEAGVSSAELEELRRENARLREQNEELRDDVRSLKRSLERRERESESGLMRPVRHVGRQIGNLFEWLAMYALIVALGLGAVFFGRKYLEGVADTARRAPLRSWLVGMAAAFLAVPVFILGTFALVVSIVGIPALIAWLPLFPVAVVLATGFGYLAVAHAAGEALAERRLHGGDWFTKANSYYYVVTGTGLLVALFGLKHVIAMVGVPIIPGMLAFLGALITWAALSIGLGAVLISRGGTQPYGTAAGTAATTDSYDDVFSEEPHV